MIFGGPEFDLVPEITKLKTQLHSLIDSKRIHLFVDKNKANYCIANLIENLLFPAMERAGKKIISEKTPANVLVFHELIEICPDAKYIFVIRDPRAVIASMKDVKNKYIKKYNRPPRNFTKNIHQSILYTKKSIDAGFDFYQKYPDKVFVVQYEQMIANPVEMTQNLCAFIGITWDQSMMNPNQMANTNKEGVGIDDVWYSKEKYFRGIQTGENEKWQTILTNIEKAMVAKAFKNCKQLSEIGYKITYKNMPFFKKIAGCTLYESNNFIWKYFNRTYLSKLASRAVVYGRTILNKLNRIFRFEQ
jgi:hypothetical protein